MKKLFVLGCILFWALGIIKAQAQVATHSFTNLPSRGTYPDTIKIKGQTLKINLSPLKNAKHIYRAYLFINVNPYWWVRFQKVPEKEFCLVTNLSNGCLPTVPPRHIYFDLTKVLKRALSQGTNTIVVKMKNAPAHGIANPPWFTDEQKKALVHLDVMCDLNLPNNIPGPEPSFVKVYSRAGDTMLVWKEPKPLVRKEKISVKEYKVLLHKAEGPGYQLRYRIYKSKKPITASNILEAELLDEVHPLSAWNEEFLGKWQDKNEQKISTLPVDNGQKAQPDEVIYVSRNKQEGNFYYAVVKVIDGQEDFSRLVLGKNSLKNPLHESLGPGLVLLNKKEIRKKFYYVDGPIEMNFFVRWEAPSNANLPSIPFNYLVARSLNPKHQPRDGKHPVNINLHCWGGSLLGGYLWWYEAEMGSLLLTTNQRPYDWWTGYNEARGTYLSFSKHRVYNYTQKRILSFLKDFVFKNWPVNEDRIILSGSSMGGGGTIMWGIREGKHFAYIKGEVGVYIPLESPQFSSSFYSVYGNPAWPVKYGSTDLNPYVYWDTAKWLKDNVRQETPFIIFANGRNDKGIGWAQAWKVVKALQETKRPFVFRWDMSGHGTRSHFPGGGDRRPTIFLTRNISLPAFTNCSLDTPIGDSPEDSPPKGQINYYLLWKPETIVDKPDRWEITIYLSPKAPRSSCNVDVTPRRLQHFSIIKDNVYYWKNIDLSTKKIIATGEITPDNYGLLTIPNIEIFKSGNRLQIWTQEFINQERQENNNTDEEDNINNDSNSTFQDKNRSYLFLPDFEEIDSKIVIGPEEAENLPSIVNSISENTTLFLRDGFYPIGQTIWITRPGITIRSLSGKRENVILSGNYRVGEILGIKASRVTIADLTIKEAFYHAIHLGGKANKVKLINLHLLDCGEQLIKVNPDQEGNFNDFGILAYSLLEYTDEGRLYIRDSLGGGSCYTNGIDILKGRRWHIIGNTFRNIYCPPGRTFPQAILVWQGSRDTIIEKNKIINCPIGIQLGLGSKNRRQYKDLNYTASHIGGIVKNNFIFVEKGKKFDTGIGLWASRDVIVINNTIYGPERAFASIDLRFKETKATVWNNLLFKTPLLREGAQGDLRQNRIAIPAWFRDPQNGDLHLNGKIPEVVDQGIPHHLLHKDIDEDLRDENPDIGADEYYPFSLLINKKRVSFQKIIYPEKISLIFQWLVEPAWKEIFIWIDSPYGRYCYFYPQQWFSCNSPFPSYQGEIPPGEYLLFESSIPKGYYQLHLRIDNNPDKKYESKGLDLIFQIKIPLNPNSVP